MIPPEHSARRLVIVGVTFFLTVAIAMGCAAWALHGAALKAAAPLYAQRETLLREIDPAKAPERPFIAWFGDSTIADYGGGGVYPLEIARQTPELRPWIIACPGLDPYGYYFLMGSVLPQRPSAIVLIADLRLLTGGPPRPDTHLADQLPAAELPRAALLPLHARGWTVPRLLLARLMRWDWYADAVYVSDGLRDLWQHSPAWGFAGPTGVPTELARAVFDRALADGPRSYDVPIGEDTPSVQMLGAAVRMATARKMPTLVIVTPIPWQSLERSGLYRRDTVEARIAAIRKVVEANGGVLLDLHRFMRDDGFRDNSGHFNRTGSARMADRVTPALIDLVTDAPRRP